MKNHREHRVRYLFEFYGPDYKFIPFLHYYFGDNNFILSRTVDFWKRIFRPFNPHQ